MSVLNGHVPRTTAQKVRVLGQDRNVCSSVERPHKCRVRLANIVTTFNSERCQHMLKLRCRRGRKNKISPIRTRKRWEIDVCHHRNKAFRDVAFKSFARSFIFLQCRRRRVEKPHRLHTISNKYCVKCGRPVGYPIVRRQDHVRRCRQIVVCSRMNQCRPINEQTGPPLQAQRRKYFCLLYTSPSPRD